MSGKVMLIDADGSIPNLALMRLSTWLKGKGKRVKLLRLGMSYWPPWKTKFVMAHGFDEVWVSVLFTQNAGKIKINGSRKAPIFGGTGVSLSVTLPPGAEGMEPDYSIYPEFDFSVGFISRGCIRKCGFCFVPRKEGALRQVARPMDLVRHKKILFLDNNFLALKNHKHLLREIKDTGALFQFNQGLDARLLDEETAGMLAGMRTWSALYFAYDSIALKKIVEPKIVMMAGKVSAWKLRLYLYVHPEMNIGGDVMERVRFCAKHEVLPYVMRDLACIDSAQSGFYIDLASWANQPHLFKNMGFEEFLRKRHGTDRMRNKQSLRLFNSN